jgi:hypothetical protein
MCRRHSGYQEEPPAFGLIFAIILKGKILQTYMKIRKTQTVYQNKWVKRHYVTFNRN